MTRGLAVPTALFLLLGLGGCSSGDGHKTAARIPTSTTPTASDQCAPSVEVVASSKVPKDVARWSGGRPVVGVEHLWTVRSALDVPASYQENVWRLKFPWFTRPFGLPRIDARRLDGAGTFRASVNRADDQSGTWVASTLDFSHAGCWEVSARYFDTGALRFRVRVGRP